MQSQRSQRVLIVDDHVDGVDALADLFQSLGWTVDKAYSGADALAVAAASLPDVVVLDINMPIMDGFEAARRLQEIGLGRIRILAYTGSAASPVTRLTGSEHIECMISKGSPMEVLIENVQVALSAGPR